MLFILISLAFYVAWPFVHLCINRLKEASFDLICCALWGSHGVTVKYSMAIAQSHGMPVNGLCYRCPVFEALYVLLFL